MRKINSGFSKINKILPYTAKQYKLESAVTKYAVMNYWEEALIAFVARVEGQTKAVDFKNGVLVVACLSPELAQDIKRLADRIIYALNQLLGKTLVYNIKLEI